MAFLFYLVQCDNKRPWTDKCLTVKTVKRVRASSWPFHCWFSCTDSKRRVSINLGALKLLLFVLFEYLCLSKRDLTMREENEVFIDRPKLNHGKRWNILEFITVSSFLCLLLNGNRKWEWYRKFIDMHECLQEMVNRQTMGIHKLLQFIVRGED